MLTPAEAIDLPGEHLSPADAIGRTSLEFVWAYPPGVPLLTPGEVVDESVVTLLTAYGAEGVTLHSTTGAMPDKIFVGK